MQPFRERRLRSGEVILPTLCSLVAIYAAGAVLKYFGLICGEFLLLSTGVLPALLRICFHG